MASEPGLAPSLASGAGSAPDVTASAVVAENPPRIAAPPTPEVGVVPTPKGPAPAAPNGQMPATPAPAPPRVSEAS
jgi:hypothetical protein